MVTGLALAQGPIVFDGISFDLNLFSLIGFEFSPDEPSALIQKEGGPCGVIAPVQAFLLKILLMDTPGHSFSDVCRM